MGLKKGHSFSLGLHIAVFQAEIYAIRACIMEKLENSYTGRNIHILSSSQAAIKALDSFQIKLQISLGLPLIPGETDRT
jgi:hypothetical protein